MATAEQVASASLGWILEKDAIAPLTAGEIEDFIFAMNNYMLALDGENVTLGYTVVTSAADEITIPAGTLRGLIANMAIELSPSFDATENPRLNQIAIDGLKQMRLIGQSMGDSAFPDTLPIGSGNENDGGSWNWFHFFEGEEASILAESTGQISLETNTNEAIHNES